MINKYFLVAVLYKLMSSTLITRKIYRLSANLAGSYLRTKKHFDIGWEREIVNLINKYCQLQKDDYIIELGSGWFHRFSNYIRLFYDVKITLFDVADNRQFNALAHYMNSLQSHFSDKEKNSLKKSIDEINKINSISTFDEYYKYMDFDYVLNLKGNLSPFSSDKYSIVFSVNVFEHININSISIADYFKDIYRLLKPGGYSIHIIDIGDHLHWMDRKNTHRKEYLKYSDTKWKRYFESELKYINRIQVSEWLQLFENAGFNIIHKFQRDVDIDFLKIDDQYKKFAEEDLKCSHLIIVHQKPLK